jgi:acyl-CoA reductase-like NAD-dependent aldehyde dehydrogenase
MERERLQEWLESPGLGTTVVTEKATGAKLVEIGVASAEDISAAATSARIAQKAWAKLPGPKRGDVLREVSRLLLANSKEIADPLIRETGSIRAKAQWEVETTAREFLEAAALGSQPQGILTASLEAGRQSLARRILVGVIGIITPWNSPRAAPRGRNATVAAAAGTPGAGLPHGAPTAMPKVAVTATSRPPIITINGDNPATVAIGSTYADLGARITAPAADGTLGLSTL